MINKKILLGLAATALSVSAFTTTAATKAPGSGPNPFSDCGIGAALFKDTKWAAVTSNVIWDIGTTAVTSATASPETCSGKQVQTAKFIIDNYDNIAENIAKGDGKHLTAMYQVLGCSTHSQQAITGDIRKNMAVVVTQDNYTEQKLVDKASQLYNVVTDSVNKAPAASCLAS